MDKLKIAVVLHARGQRALWVVAAVAERSMVEGTGALLAGELRVSHSYVRRLAGAYVTYRDLCHLQRTQADLQAYLPVRHLRDALPLEHFVELGEWWRKNNEDFSPPEMGSELFSALDTATKEHVSAKAMRAYLDEQVGGKPIWRLELDRVLVQLEKFEQADDSSDLGYAAKIFRVLTRALTEN